VPRVQTHAVVYALSLSLSLCVLHILQVDYSTKECVSLVQTHTVMYTLSLSLSLSLCVCLTHSVG